MIPEQRTVHAACDYKVALLGNCNVEQVRQPIDEIPPCYVARRSIYVSQDDVVIFDVPAEGLTLDNCRRMRCCELSFQAVAVNDGKAVEGATKSGRTRLPEYGVAAGGAMPLVMVSVSTMKPISDTNKTMSTMMASSVSTLKPISDTNKTMSTVMASGASTLKPVSDTNKTTFTLMTSGASTLKRVSDTTRCPRNHREWRREFPRLYELRNVR